MSQCIKKIDINLAKHNLWGGFFFSFLLIMGWNWTKTSICDIHSITHVFLLTHFSLLKHSQRLKSGETALRNPIPFEHVTQSPITVHSHTSLWVGVTTTQSCCNAASRPVLQSHLSARQTSACRLKRVNVWVWLHKLSEAALMLWGFPCSGGNIAQSVLKYVISGPCPHTGVQKHAII